MRISWLSVKKLKGCDYKTHTNTVREFIVQLKEIFKWHGLNIYHP